MEQSLPGAIAMLEAELAETLNAVADCLANAEHRRAPAGSRRRAWGRAGRCGMRQPRPWLSWGGSPKTEVQMGRQEV